MLFPASRTQHTPNNVDFGGVFSELWIAPLDQAVRQISIELNHETTAAKREDMLQARPSQAASILLMCSAARAHFV